ncbi:NAD(P)-dependent glycerol-1-phosphate dehydrogenase [Candidatus Bathyarchaeota archaeon]|nr:MAG: NAD(P)-dependent glycerol-1-phosphate dehydrogenase [Candidatus Bathyarchaeota archaeon]
MELPRKVIVGNDVLNTVGKTCKALGLYPNALVVTGPHTHKVAGKPVVDSLKDSGFNVDCCVVEGADLSSINKIEKKASEVLFNVMLGVGGGRVIDITKYVSAKNRIPFVSVPTSASHDGIASPQVSLKSLKSPVSVKAQTPLAILVDIQVILDSPFRLTISGCGDIIAKFTATRDWLLAHNLKNEYYGDYAANLALMSAKLVAKNANLIHEGSVEGLRIVVEALVSCGVAMSIAGSSRPCSGSEHLFSHALDMIAPNHALHGEQCGVGTIMMAYLHKMNWKKIKSVLKKIGAPTTAEELNVTSEQVVEALTKAHTVNPERYTILGEKGLNREAAFKLAKNTGVI